MSKQINQYTKIRTSGTFTPEDLMDFDSTEDSGTTYESAKGDIANFLAYVNNNVNNIYNVDGTILANRTLTANSNFTKWLGGDVVVQMDDEVTDYAFLVRDNSATERARLGYDQATFSGELILSSLTSGNYFTVKDDDVNSRFGYQINGNDFLTARCNGDNGSNNFNVLVGRSTPTGITTGAGGNRGLRNTVVNAGGQALTEGYENVIIGYLALNKVTLGHRNIAIGSSALFNLDGTTDSNETFNVVIGSATYNNLTTGAYHVGIGQSAGINVTSGNANLCLGYNAGASTAGAYSHSIAIGREARFNASNQFVVGASSSGAFIQNFFFGKGISQTALDNNGIKFQASSISAGITDSTFNYPFIIAGSQGTGTGYGGDIIFKTAPAGATGSTQNSLVTILTVKAKAGVINITNIPTDPTGLVTGDVYSNAGVLTIV